MVRGRMREGEEFSILNRHLLLQIGFSVAVLGVFHLASVWGGERTQLSSG